MSRVPARAVDAATTRLLGLPPRRCAYTVTSSIPVRARDGARLLTEHFAPEGRALGTVLMRSPYQRIGLLSQFLAGQYASRGYHVVLQSTRGTFGSDGDYSPGGGDIDDGADTLAWLREQPWYEGRLALVGGSALSYTMWAMLVEPPPELVAVAAFATFDNGFSVTHGDGAFALYDNLTLCQAMARQQQQGRTRVVSEMLSALQRGESVFDGLPVAELGERLVGPHSSWFRDSATQVDPADHYWRARDSSAALERVNVPVRLMAGWQDKFLGETLEEYQRLRARGVRVALTAGGWTHLEMASRGAPRLFNEMFSWVDAGGDPSDSGEEPVAYEVTGGGGWRAVSGWPPPTVDQVLFLSPGGELNATTPTVTAQPAAFTYNPSDPTPTVGGRTISPRAGYQEDSDLARRTDTLTFVSAPLREPLEIVGSPRVTLAHHSDHPRVDLWVRVSEVHLDGRSHNVTETFRGEPVADAAGRVELELDATAHRFAAGSRIGLLVGGGSFPRYARNLGTGGNRALGTTMATARHVIDLASGASTLTLPISAEGVSRG